MVARVATVGAMRHVVVAVAEVVKGVAAMPRATAQTWGHPATGVPPTASQSTVSARRATHTPHKSRAPREAHAQMAVVTGKGKVNQMHNQAPPLFAMQMCAQKTAMHHAANPVVPAAVANQIRCAPALTP